TVTGSGTSYQVTIASGLDSLNGTVTLGLVASTGIVDSATNALDVSATPTTNEISYTLDNTAPTITSIARTTPTDATTNADSLSWTVTFSETVTGVNDADFTLTGATTATPTISGSGTSYQVTIASGLDSLDGTVTLGLADNTGIIDGANNALDANATPTTNEISYTLDNTAPTVTITAASTVSAAFTATFTFNEAVTGFDAISDITVTNGTTTVPVVDSSNPLLYTTTITPTTLATATASTITINVDASVATDTVGNDNVAATAFSVSFTPTDTTAPTITSIARTTPADEFTNADSLSWTVTFSETVTGVNTGDFTLTGATTATPTVTGSGAVYLVTFTGGDIADLNGTVTLGLAASTGIIDSANNALDASATPTTNEVSYTLDNIAPTITSIARTTPATVITNADSLTWTVTFSDTVTGVDAADFTLTGATTATPTVTGSGTN
ncbi:MAG: hypothetical protein HFP77_00070, partial [Methylococcales symbiont of Iophon sp. n. MRB-2018]